MAAAETPPLTIDLRTIRSVAPKGSRYPGGVVRVGEVTGRRQSQDPTVCGGRSLPAATGQALRTMVHNPHARGRESPLRGGLSRSPFYDRESQLFYRRPLSLTPRRLFGVKRRENRGGWRLRGKPLKRLRFRQLESGWKEAGIRLAVFLGFGKASAQSQAHGPLVLPGNFTFELRENSRFRAPAATQLSLRKNFFSRGLPSQPGLPRGRSSRSGAR